MASNLSRVNAGGHLLWNLGLEEGVELLPGQCCRVGVGSGILDNHAEVVFAVLLPQLQDVVGSLVVTGAVQPGSEGVGVGEVEVPGHQRDVAIETLANDVDMGGVLAQGISHQFLVRRIVQLGDLAHLGLFGLVGFGGVVSFTLGWFGRHSGRWGTMNLHTLVNARWWAKLSRVNEGEGLAAGTGLEQGKSRCRSSTSGGGPAAERSGVRGDGWAEDARRTVAGDRVGCGALNGAVKWVVRREKGQQTTGEVKT